MAHIGWCNSSNWFPHWCIPAIKTFLFYFSCVCVCICFGVRKTQSRYEKLSNRQRTYYHMIHWSYRVLWGEVSFSLNHNILFDCLILASAVYPLTHSVCCLFLFLSINSSLSFNQIWCFFCLAHKSHEIIPSSMDFFGVCFFSANWSNMLTFERREQKQQPNR